VQSQARATRTHESAAGSSFARTPTEAHPTSELAGAPISAMRLREDGAPKWRRGRTRPVWILKRSDDPDGSSSGLEEFEVHD
jgi:hypothetical protein